MCAQDARDRKYTGDNLPEVKQSSTFDDLELDAQAVVGAIKDELSRPVVD
jgi:hypothetical protein